MFNCSSDSLDLTSVFQIDEDTLPTSVVEERYEPTHFQRATDEKRVNYLTILPHTFMEVWDCLPLYQGLYYEFQPYFDWIIGRVSRDLYSCPILCTNKPNKATTHVP